MLAEIEQKILDKSRDLKGCSLKVSRLISKIASKVNFDRSAAMYYIFDLSTGEFLYISDSSNDMLGFSPEEIMKFGIEGYIELINKDDLEKLDLEYHSSHPISGYLNEIKYRIRTFYGSVKKVKEERFIFSIRDENDLFMLGIVYID